MPELTEKQKKKQEANRRFREKERLAKLGQTNGAVPHPADVAQAHTDAQLESWAEPDPVDPSTTVRTWTRTRKPRKPSAPNPNRRPRGLNKKTRAKLARAAKTPKPPKVKKVSQLDAAALILQDVPGDMSPAGLVAAMKKKKLWDSPNGKTPDATLSAAIIREITKKGAQSRFRKTGRGRYETTRPTQE